MIFFMYFLTLYWHAPQRYNCSLHYCCFFSFIFTHITMRCFRLPQVFDVFRRYENATRGSNGLRKICLKRVMINYVNLILPSVAFLHALQISENYWFSDSFRGYKNETLRRNGLKGLCLRRVMKNYVICNPLLPSLDFLYPLKISEYNWFSDIF